MENANPVQRETESCKQSGKEMRSDVVGELRLGRSLLDPGKYDRLEPTCVLGRSGLPACTWSHGRSSGGDSDFSPALARSVMFLEGGVVVWFYFSPVSVAF